MPSKNEPMIGGHAVAIVGYDDAKERVMFANSWGRGWGDNGFGYLPYSYLANPQLTSEAWTFKLLE